MEYKKLPTTFIYEHIVELPNTNPFYKTYKFNALHKNKYLPYLLKATVFNKTNFSPNLYNKYNTMMKTLNQVPNEFTLAQNKMFRSSDLMEVMEKPMIISYYNEKTLKDYLNEIKEFVNTNNNNNLQYKKNFTRIQNNCLEALRALHSAGFCYNNIHMDMFQGNYNLSEIYLQQFENMRLCNNMKHQQNNINQLKEIFSFYKL